MEIKTRVEKLKENRIQAQSWFSNQKKRLTSVPYDNRETATIRTLSIETVISYYQYKFHRLPKSLLDIGCGQGYTLKYVSEEYPIDILTGIDSSKEAISDATKLNIGAEFICEDIERIQLKTIQSYDVIFIHLCFGLFSNPLKVLETLKHYMSKESLIYIIDLDRDSLGEGIRFSTSKDEELYLRDQYNASFTLPEFKQLLEYNTTKENRLSFKVGTSIIGGFNQFSPEFLSLIQNKRIQETLNELSREKNEDSNELPDLLHAWIIKSENSIS